MPQRTEPARAVVENQLKSIKRLRGDVGIHTKMGAVATMVKTTIEQGEKIILFCHHHATAQELTAHLASVVTNPTTTPWPKPVWKKAWNQVLKPADHEDHSDRLRDTFIGWLCSDLICAQTWSWLPSSTSEARLADVLRETKGRHHANPETIDEAAN